LDRVSRCHWHASTRSWHTSRRNGDGAVHRDGATVRDGSGDAGGPETRFEVVAVKPIDNANNAMTIMMTPGGLESSVPVGVLLRQALQKPDYQMTGAPAWINTERYSIRAKPPAGTPPAAMSVMIRNLLKDRFQLATRVETREQPIFLLPQVHL
jgi:hypothetical protein